MLTKGISNFPKVKNIISLNNSVCPYIHSNCTSTLDLGRERVNNNPQTLIVISSITVFCLQHQPLMHIMYIVQCKLPPLKCLHSSVPLKCSHSPVPLKCLHSSVPLKCSYSSVPQKCSHSSVPLKC